ncbi:hypothetical protein D5274_18660 [bacterium 1XD42-94]|nr:hypothetical protein [bacterium 1XD42-94]
MRGKERSELVQNPRERVNITDYFNNCVKIHISTIIGTPDVPNKISPGPAGLILFLRSSGQLCLY